MMLAFRSTHSDVAKAITDYRAAMTAWRANADKLLAELGFPGRDFAVSYGLGSRWVVGLEYTIGDPIPAGWRVAERAGLQVIVPDKRRKAGKEIADRLDACKPPDDLRMNLPGMPPYKLTDSGVYTPALREMDGAVWVTWKSAVTATDVDDTLWKRVKLSEYFAAVEAQDGGEDGG